MATSDVRKQREENLNDRIKRLNALQKKYGQSDKPLEKSKKPSEEKVVQGDFSDEGSYDPDDINVSCVPCARAHLTAVWADLDEALRFARGEPEGVEHEEVQTRLETAEKEIVSIERHDWTPAKIQNSPEEEQEIIREYLPRIRRMRQKLLNEVTDPESLEEAAAHAEQLNRDFRRTVMGMQGVDVHQVLDLAKQVDSGEITMDEAKEQVRESVKGSEG